MTRRPEGCIDETWDVTFLKLDYHGRRIEFGDSSTEFRFFSAGDGRWEKQQIDYTNSNTRIIGINNEVMPKVELTHYKSSPGREADLIDVGRITGVSSWRD